jgi:NADPH:quinone reductase-like Zn-dependent oxidoreductase
MPRPGGLDPANSKGKRVLINGASGGVGLAAIQIAKAKGLHVTAVASARNQALMRGYEADVTLDYRAQQLQSAVKPPVDLAIDAVDLATAAASAKVVKPGGVLIDYEDYDAGAGSCGPGGIGDDVLSSDLSGHVPSPQKSSLYGPRGQPLQSNAS